MLAALMVSPNNICMTVEVTGVRPEGHNSHYSGRCTLRSHVAVSGHSEPEGRNGTLEDNSRPTVLRTVGWRWISRRHGGEGIFEGPHGDILSLGRGEGEGGVWEGEGGAGEGGGWHWRGRGGLRWGGRRGRRLGGRGDGGAGDGGERVVVAGRGEGGAREEGERRRWGGSGGVALGMEGR
ncbi:hypothetical protein GUJ93_ZPchr0009g1730 [Zizania palustris]|uniref:Uncharacterized protein n=1 Tax=Zizania palustris TaxID=103762 RepID=A0A8J5VIE0_ZIZPA|nr:hypothetical protein GUJ93_ZPchr0009g1730 [Zizania palustris]